VSDLVNLFFYDGFFSLNKLTFSDLKFHLDLTLLKTSGIYYLTPQTFDFSNHHVLKLLYGDVSEFFCFISFLRPSTSILNLSSELTNTELLGWLVYTYTFFIFLVISLILLISMIGSIILVLNQNINIKRQLIFRQTLRDLKSSVSLKY
jgi:hypothetical protein